MTHVLKPADYELKDGRVRVERPTLPARPSTLVRFMEKVEIQKGGCWIWQGEVAANGYGGFRHPETKWAHRAAHLLLKGPIPDGQTVDHLCYVKRCVNPDHLALTDGIDNVRRASEGWGNCDRLHPGAPTRVGQKRSGIVFCKECHSVRERERRAKRAELAAPRMPHDLLVSG